MRSSNGLKNHGRWWNWLFSFWKRCSEIRMRSSKGLENHGSCCSNKKRKDVRRTLFQVSYWRLTSQQKVLNLVFNLVLFFRIILQVRKYIYTKPQDWKCYSLPWPFHRLNVIQVSFNFLSYIVLCTWYCTWKRVPKNSI